MNITVRVDNNKAGCIDDENACELLRLISEGVF